MSRPAILLTRMWPQPVLDRLAAHYTVTVDPRDKPLTQAELADAMRSFDAVCPTVSDRIDAAVIGQGGRARILANYGVGFDHIDRSAAKAAGIVVTNTPGVLTEATAELAITLMLMAARRTGEGERELRAGQWSGWRPTHLVGTGLTGKTLGLVGFGRIGQAVAQRARHGLGMRIAYTGRRPVDEAGLSDAEYVADLDALIERSDVVSLHCPGGEETRKLIDRKRLGRFRPGAILINTARGSVVDDVALVDALQTGALASAGLDVYADEPAVPPALLALQNVVLLPHLGSATIESRAAMGFCVADNLDAFFAGKEPPSRVV